MKTNLTILLVLISMFAYGQHQPSFLKDFKIETLPVEVTFSQCEMNFVLPPGHIDTLGGFHCVYDSNGFCIDSLSVILTEDFVKNHLLLDTKFFSMINPFAYNFQIDTSNTATPSTKGYYAIAMILLSKKYYGVIYGLMLDKRSTPIDKYFCTIDKSGKFISQLRIAELEVYGENQDTYPCNNGWSLHVSCHGKINNDLTINVNDHGYKRNYIIQPDGKIVRIK